MEYKVISGDGHIDLKWLPHDLFVSSAPAKWRDRVPQVLDTKDGKRWHVEGVDILTRPMGGFGDMTPMKRGSSKHIDRMWEVGFYEEGPHPSTPELRIKDQGIDGVDAEVIYGILTISGCIEDPELVPLVYGIYNDWAADFRRTNPDRLVPLACIPNSDPQIAAAELRRVAKLDLRGADFDVSNAVKPIWHRDWDPLWAAADECNLPLSFHTTGFPLREPSDQQMREEYSDQWVASLITLFQLVGAEFLTEIIFSGALERYPGFKFVLGECGVSWIPYMLTRMDQEYEDQFHHLFPMKPSDYWRRQGTTTFQHEATLADMVHLVGEDNIVWGSDYPHPDGIWPDSLKLLDEDLAGLDERVRRKITCENAGRLYGLIK
jgi:predicted TIM-barrel fold metal-dependent hydrolase